MNKKFFFASGILCGIMVVIYTLQLIFPSITYSLALNVSSLSLHPWTFFTSIFVHSPANALHLLNNLFFLFVFGLFLERILNSGNFLILFVLGGLVANISAFTFYPNSFVLGASGAISTVILTLTVLRPKLIGLYFGIPMRMYLIAILWFAVNFVLIFAGGDIAAEAHLYGAAFGLLAGFYLRTRIKLPEDPRSLVVEENDPSEQEIDQWEREHMK